MEKGRDERGRAKEKDGQSERAIEGKIERVRLYKNDGKTETEKER